MWKRDMKKLIARQEEELQALRSELAEKEKAIAEFKAKEKAIADALITAKERGNRIITEAETAAAETTGAAAAGAEAAITEATVRAEALLTDAKTAAETMTADARSSAETLLSEARQKSSMLLAQAEASVREYEETIAAYNDQLARAAAEAQANAERFALYTRKGRVSPVTLGEETKNLHEIPLETEELPDASDSPSQLMQNIYRIQRRTLPEDMDLSAAPAEEEEEPAAPAEEQSPDETDLLIDEFLRSRSSDIS